MKTFGKMSIAFLYDDETDIIVNEPLLEASQQSIPPDVLRRVYVALGMHLHGLLVSEKYDDSDTETIKAMHGELLGILEGEEMRVTNDRSTY